MKSRREATGVVVHAPLPEIGKKAFRSAAWFFRPNEVAWIYVKRDRQLAEHSNAGRYLGTLDLPDVTRTDAGAMRQLLLRQLLVMTRLTQVYGHDLLEVHDMDGTCLGIIVPGTIVPIFARLW